MLEQVLNQDMQSQLRAKGHISDHEVVICEGDLYYAKNVLTNEKRMVSKETITTLVKNEAISENRRTLLKG